MPLPPLLARFKAVRNATATLCRPLSPEDMMVQSCAEASPVKWHLAHTSWFFETFVLSEFLASYTPLPSRLPLALQQLLQLARRDAGKEAAFLLLAASPRSHPRLSRSRRRRHRAPPPASRRRRGRTPHRPGHRARAAASGTDRNRHQARPLHQSAPPALHRAHGFHLPTTIAPPLDWIDFAPGLVEIGLTPDPSSLDAFAFDNETPRHPVYIAPFRLATRLSPAPSISPSSIRTATTVPSSGSLKAGLTMRSEGGRLRSTGMRDSETKSGWSIYTLRGLIPLKSSPRRPSVISASSKPMPTPAGQAIGCPRNSSGSTPPCSNLRCCSQEYEPTCSKRPSSPHSGSTSLVCSRSSATCGSGPPALHRLSRLRSSARSARRIQRQVHELADGAARRLLRHSRNPYPCHLSQLLRTGHALAVLRNAACARCRPIALRFVEDRSS